MMFRGICIAVLLAALSNDADAFVAPFRKAATPFVRFTPASSSSLLVSDVETPTDGEETTEEEAPAVAEVAIEEEAVGEAVVEEAVGDAVVEETVEEAVVEETVEEAVVEEAVEEAVVEEAVGEAVVAEESAEAAKRKVERVRHTLFVGNLPFDTGMEAVKEMFDAHGTVELVNVPRDRKTGTARGFAFVDMSTAEELDAAIEAMHDSSFGGRVLRVTKSVPKDQVEKKERPKTPKGKKIYVGNIPFDLTKEEIIDFYSEHGEVVEVYIPVDGNTGVGRGFAFVTMKDEDADAAIAATNGMQLGGRNIVVSLPLPPGEKAPPRGNNRAVNLDRTKLYVGNLSFYTVAETMREIFEEFGTVHDCYLPEDPSTGGGSRGFGFVTMDKEAAQAAIEELDGCEVDGRIIRVNEAQPKRTNSDRFYNDEDAVDADE